MLQSGAGVLDGRAPVAPSVVTGDPCADCVAVLAVAGITAYVSYPHPYAVMCATGRAASLPTGTYAKVTRPVPRRRHCISDRLLSLHICTSQPYAAMRAHAADRSSGLPWCWHPRLSCLVPLRRSGAGTGASRDHPAGAAPRDVAVEQSCVVSVAGAQEGAAARRFASQSRRHAE
jgi:hypothetical protein